ncbi:hypothetical protein [Trichloromonas sp.]|uniref:hypothetical protein n=1 Tax=Trichloromonas sp. TaxID=3069249 RepID=UPI002A44B114|nr:hypothetical protein [Trichloromonas sp.]
MEVWKMTEPVGTVAKGWLRAWLPGRMTRPAAARDERVWARRLAAMHAECESLRGRMDRGRYSA